MFQQQICVSAAQIGPELGPGGKIINKTGKFSLYLYQPKGPDHRRDSQRIRVARDLKRPEIFSRGSEVVNPHVDIGLHHIRQTYSIDIPVKQGMVTEGHPEILRPEFTYGSRHIPVKPEPVLHRFHIRGKESHIGHVKLRWLDISFDRYAFEKIGKGNEAVVPECEIEGKV